jgi:alpha-mannosidase/mannosylglycerate hydrolase
MENNCLSVTVNNNGTFDIFDKACGKWYREMNLFEDTSEVGAGFARQTVRREETIYSYGAGADIAVVEDYPFRASFRVRLSLQVPAGADPSENGRTKEIVAIPIESVISIDRSGARVDVTTTIVNTARNHRLRALFPADIDSRFVYVGQPFDVVKRNITPKDPNNYDPLPHYYPWTTHAQNGFVDFNDGTNGLTIGSDTLYEYEVIDNGEKSVAITLLRCMNKLEFGGHAENEEEYMELAQCIGSFTIRYSVIPHNGGYENSYPVWEDFKTPLRMFTARAPEEIVLSGYQDPLQKITLPAEKSFLKVEGKNVIISAVKKHGERNSLIVRVHNYGDKETFAEIRPEIPGFTPRTAFAANLAERRISEVKMRDGGVAVNIPPHGLATVEFE